MESRCTKIFLGVLFAQITKAKQYQSISSPGSARTLSCVFCCSQTVSERKTLYLKDESSILTMIPTMMMMMMMMMMISTWSNSSRLLLTCIATSCSIWPWTWFSFLCGDDYQPSLIQFTRSQSRSLSPAVVWSLQSVALFPLPKFEPTNVFVQLCFIIHTKLYSIIFNIPWPYSHKYYLFECKPLSPPNFSNFYAALPSKLCIVQHTVLCSTLCALYLHFCFWPHISSHCILAYISFATVKQTNKTEKLPAS